MISFLTAPFKKIIISVLLIHAFAIFGAVPVQTTPCIEQTNTYTLDAESVLRPINQDAVDTYFKKLHNRSRLLPVLQVGGLAFLTGLTTVTTVGYIEQYIHPGFIASLKSKFFGKKIAEPTTPSAQLTKQNTGRLAQLSNWVTTQRNQLIQKKELISSVLNQLQATQNQTSSTLLKNIMLPIISTALAQSITSAISAYIPASEIFNRRLTYDWFIKTQTQYTINLDLCKRSMTQLQTQLFEIPTRQLHSLCFAQAAQGLIVDIEKILAFIRYEKSFAKTSERITMLHTIEQALIQIGETFYIQANNSIKLLRQATITEQDRQTIVQGIMQTISYLELYGHKLTRISAVQSPFLPQLLA
jgi:hypothetical protein